MKHASLWIATLLVATCLVGCAKEPAPAAETAKSEPAPTGTETTANAGGTTTYFGSSEEPQ